jgi:predicted DsbA family dithiol-disulfide isomerase
MKVEIWSDIMCPFCYLGKHRFEKAVAQFPHKDKIEIVWKSFQLDPTLKGVISKESYFAKKGFPEAQYKAMTANIASAAVEEGLEMNMDDIIISNTTKAHLLLQLAKSLGKSNLAEEVLFYMYFTEGYNIDDEASLFEAGKRLGIDREKVANALENKELIAAFEKDLMEAQQFGISGVPFFIFDRKYAVSGAQAPDHFLGALNQSFQEWEAKQSKPFLDISASDTGKSCDISGNCI